MPKPLDPQTKKQLVSRVNYYREMGIYDFYRRPVEEGSEMVLHAEAENSTVETMTPKTLIKGAEGRLFAFGKLLQQL